jgi:two-component system sensor histidine kinase DesK
MKTANHVTQANFEPSVDIEKAIGSSNEAKWSYFSLFFSLFYFLPLPSMYSTQTKFELVVIGLIYIGFLFFHTACVRSFSHKSYLPITGIILVSSIGSYCYPGTSSLFGYAAFFSGYYFVARKAFLWLVINLASQILAAYFFNLWSFYFLGIASTITLALFMYGFFMRKEKLHQLTKDKQNEYIEKLAAIAERERIARDMHDLLGHSLSSLALKSELAEKFIDKKKYEDAKEEISDVAVLARHTLSEVRQAVTGLNKKHLASALDELLIELDRLGFETHKYVEIPFLEPKKESALQMICKEWVTNIMRHSNGKTVSLYMEQEGDQLVLIIKDNGTTRHIQAGNGINGMKSRVAELNGSFDLSFDNGVSLVVRLPL